MRFSAAFLDELRARVPISQVVGRAVQWDRRKSNPGRGDFWACCPFHAEKTPSFHVDDRKGYYYCFGCHAKGDHIRFLTDKEGLSFTDAVAELAALAGMALPEPDPAAQKKAQEAATLADIMEMAAGFYENQLAAAAGAAARAYVAGRGLSPEAMERFRLGFAPDRRDALLQHLKRRGVEMALMERAGLVAAPEDGGAPYDRFRNRLMFPIRDRRGRVIAFGGRALGEARAKYLNSPQTELFDKSRVLYNLDLAGQPAFEAGAVIAVEGYMDVIALSEAGLANVVAPLGTALTEQHLHLLWRMAPTPVLCFDGDAAGQRAAERAAELALEHLRPGHSLSFVLLPDGLDPDDFVRENGAAAFQALLNDADGLLDFLWRRLVGQAPRATPEERAALERRALELPRRIADETVRRHYTAEIRARLRALWGRGGYSGRRNGPGGARRRMAAGPVSRQLRARVKAEEAGTFHAREILRLTLGRPDILPDVLEELAGLPMRRGELDRLRRKIIDIAASGAELDSARLRAHLEDAGLRGALERLAGSGGLEQEQVADTQRAKEAFAALAGAIRRTAVLERELMAAQEAFKDNPTDENLARIEAIRREIDAAPGGGDSA
ncbi:MAG TPA: DNA primase [Thermopetrobacter sp.]|nr:DNA primase [Thermopetrobacter sp.]